MANIIKTSTDKVKGNLLGAAAGGVLVWWASKKYMGVEKMWLRATLAVVGAVVGANAQAMIKAKGSAPKGSDIKK
jgi:hypothetical protein